MIFRSTAMHPGFKDNVVVPYDGLRVTEMTPGQIAALAD